ALHLDRPDEIQFCENETNVARVFGGEPTAGHYKDGFHDYLVKADTKAVSSHHGTKVAGIYRRTIAAGDSATVRVRLSVGPARPEAFADFDPILHLPKPQPPPSYPPFHTA